VASGASPRKLGIKGEDRFTGQGVSYCGTCDGPLFKDKEIVVVGGGDRAIEEAIFLSGYARKVTVVHRRNELRASKILEERLQHNSKINFILDSVIEEIRGKDKVERISIKNVKTDSLSTLSCQGIFIFVGIQPNTGFLKNILEVDEVGFIITDGEMRTSRRGIFACGDCRKKTLYQVITACAEGAVAAHSAHKYIANL
jgi:thioredoxin reductase (NADPH)